MSKVVAKEITLEPVEELREGLLFLIESLEEFVAGKCSPGTFANMLEYLHHQLETDA